MKVTLGEVGTWEALKVPCADQRASDRAPTYVEDVVLEDGRELVRRERARAGSSKGRVGRAEDGLLRSDWLGHGNTRLVAHRERGGEGLVLREGGDEASEGGEAGARQSSLETRAGHSATSGSRVTYT